jgi:hypothetical protein
MKTLRYLSVVLMLTGLGAGPLHAEVNAVLGFVNYTDEELTIELSIDDTFGWLLYDLYVVPGGSSAAEFWADDPFAGYTACAYGAITGDFYGCLDGSIADYHNTVNFDVSGIPYKSGPIPHPYEWFIFYATEHSTETLFVGASGSAGGSGCFVGSLSAE